MTGSKHPKGGPGDHTSRDVPRPQDDLERNPGIGTSKGTFARTGVDPKDVEADTTIEGDVANDATPQGGVDPNQRGRTNK